jgi:hypothetical protein
VAKPGASGLLRDKGALDPCRARDLNIADCMPLATLGSLLGALTNRARPCNVVQIERTAGVRHDCTWAACGRDCTHGHPQRQRLVVCEGLC